MAAPRITHIVEVIGAQYMAAKAPPSGKTLIGHLHGATADFVN